MKNNKATQERRSEFLRYIVTHPVEFEEGETERAQQELAKTEQSKTLATRSWFKKSAVPDSRGRFA